MSWWTQTSGVVRENEPLARHTWLAVGGSATYFAEPKSVDELASLVREATAGGVAIKVLGGGSNILVRDGGVSGLVIRLAGDEFSKITLEDGKVSAGGGARLGHVVSESATAGLSGLETLVGIPGTVGGALRINAAAHGGDIGQYTASATVMNDAGEVQTRERADLVFSYGKSNLDELVILGATFELESAIVDEVSRRMQQIWIVKKKNQPLTHQSHARMFRDPRGQNAGDLIDQAGLSGTKIGGAEICDRNANYVITTEGARAADVLKLIDLVRSRVLERADIELELELEIW